MRKFRATNGDRLGRKPSTKREGAGRPKNSEPEVITFDAKTVGGRFLRREAEKHDIPVAEYLRRLIDREMKRLNGLAKRKVA